jgi:hypothetical protein
VLINSVYAPEGLNVNRVFCLWQPYLNMGPVIILINFLTAIGLAPGGSSTVHVYTQTIHRTTKSFGRVGDVLRLCDFTLAFALRLRKKHGKTSVRVAEECQLVQ